MAVLLIIYKANIKNYNKGIHNYAFGLKNNCIKQGINGTINV